MPKEFKPIGFFKRPEDNKDENKDQKVNFLY